MNTSMGNNTNENNRDGLMPLVSPAQPTQTTSATVNNPLVLTGAVSAMVPSLTMALLILRVSPVPALLVVAQSVIS
jgi:hypothetical protein